MINNINKSIESKHNPSTYGEVTQLGARQLFHYMKMYNDDDCHDIHFIDLGSGNGKLVIQAYLEISSLKQVKGIELSSIRHNIALRSWDGMKETAKVIRHKTIALSNRSNKNEMDNDLPKEYDDNYKTGLNLIQGDLFAMNVCKATHIYVASLCFTDAMMNELSTKIINECDDEILQCVATLKPFPTDFEHRSGLMKDIKYVEMSWTKPRGMGGIVYFYSRKSSP